MLNLRNIAQRCAAGVCALAAIYCGAPDLEQPLLSEVVCELGEGGGQAHAVYYRLVWDDTGITETHDGGAWTTVSDLGYEIRVDSGYIVNYSAQLVPCEEDEAEAICTARLPMAFGPRQAWAGHSSGEGDPSAVEGARVESLTHHGEIDYGAALADPQHYCRSHYLVGQLTTTADYAPEDESLLGLSMWLEGSYRAPGSEEEVAFSMRTESNYGAVAALEQGGEEEAIDRVVDSGLHQLMLVITRPRGAMFDGIDFGQFDNDRVGTEVLANLVLGTRTEVFIDGD